MVEQGIHFDVPAADYFADPCPTPSLTQSIAKVLIERSPLHAWHEHPRLGGAKPASEDEPAEKYDSAKAIGNAAHKLMIGRGKEIAIADFDSWRGNEAKAFREKAEAAGGTVILQKHFVRARNMVDIACEWSNSDLPAFDSQGNGEVVIAWQEGDLWFRSMIDWLPFHMEIVWDYKTTGLSVAPHAIPALMLNGGWDVQAAMHERGLDVLDPANAGRRKFRFVAQENTAPYALTVCELPEAVLTMGRKKLAYAVQLWSACLRADVWPSYPPEIVFPEYPAWAESKWLDREVAHDDRRKAFAHRSEPINSFMGG